MKHTILPYWYSIPLKTFTTPLLPSNPRRFHASFSFFSSVLFRAKHSANNLSDGRCCWSCFRHGWFWQWCGTWFFFNHPTAGHQRDDTNQHAFANRVNALCWVCVCVKNGVDKPCQCTFHCYCSKLVENAWQQMAALVLQKRHYDLDTLDHLHTGTE